MGILAIVQAYSTHLHVRRHRPAAPRRRPAAPLGRRRRTGSAERRRVECLAGAQILCCPPLARPFELPFPPRNEGRRL